MNARDAAAAQRQPVALSRGSASADWNGPHMSTERGDGRSARGLRSSRQRTMILVCWTTATAVGWSLGGAWVQLVTALFSQAGSVSLARAVGAAVGMLVVGTAQWAVLRHRMIGVGRWVPASALGMFVGGMLGAAGGPLDWARTGMLVGAAQWFILRRESGRAGWWILATALGMFVGPGLAPGVAIGVAMDRATGWTVGPTLIQVVDGGSLGLITGLVLAWILVRPLPAHRDAGAPGEGDFTDKSPVSTRSLTTRRMWRRDILVTAGVGAVSFFLIHTFTFRINGASMRPSLDDGQYVLVNRLAYIPFRFATLDHLLPLRSNQRHDAAAGHLPQRGDIVIVEPEILHDVPTVAVPVPIENRLVKRVIALPGERVALHDGKVLVNGVALDEPYVASAAKLPYPRHGGEITVPARSVFVVGDNRNESEDSRVFDPVSLDRVLGKVVGTYWPPSSVGGIAATPPEP